MNIKLNWIQWFGTVMTALSLAAAIYFFVLTLRVQAEKRESDRETERLMERTQRVLDRANEIPRPTPPPTPAEPSPATR